MAGDVYIANETFACELDGAPVIVHRGITRVREGHPLHQRYAGNFDKVETDIEFDIEEATAPPMRDGQSSRVRETQKAKQANAVSTEATEDAKRRSKA